MFLLRGKVIAMAHDGESTDGRPPAAGAASAALLRILHVIPGMATEIGGPPAVCAGLTAALAARGHSVTVATLNEGALPTVSLDSRVTLERFAPDGPTPGRYAKSETLDTWLQQNISKFQIAHLHSIWQFPTFAAARACWNHRVPYVSLLNGMLDTYSVNQRSRHIKRAYWLWRERKVEGRAAAIHCLNAAEIRRAVPWIRNMPKIILGNGIDASVLASLPSRGAFRAAHPDLSDRPLVVFLSRLHPKKGLDRLIPAWKAVAAKMPQCRLLIAGTGDPAYVESLKRLVAVSGLSDNILFLGQVIGGAKWNLLVDADLFVLPSHQEGFSMAITEALAADCPPVVTEECNFDELEPPTPEPQRGVIIRNSNMSQFCDAIITLLSDARRRASFAAAGKELVASRFTWQTIAEQLESDYRHILAGRSFSPSGTPVKTQKQ
jgi:glycosyltransferase involved in cell wall biosynthesis